MNELKNELFSSMGELSNDGYFIYNTAKQQFDYINNALANIWEQDLALVKTYPNILIAGIDPEDQEHAISCYEECLADMVPKKYEIRLLIVNIEKYVRFSIFPFETTAGAILCGTIEDITIAKQNKIHIEQINAHKNVTLEILSHDLKEPLGMMKITASAIEKEVADMGSLTVMNSLALIKEMCERNIKLVRSMINHEFLKSAVIKLKKERADIVWEVRDVVRFYRRSHLRDLKEFNFSTSHEKIHLSLDSMKFLQVINNLISNSIKFTAYGGIIDVTIKDQDTTVLLIVTDNGIGIPNALKSDLFNRGRVALKSGLNGEESGGLGMSIIKSIVEMHGGVVWFESEEGLGTSFYIEIPK